MPVQFTQCAVTFHCTLYTALEGHLAHPQPPSNPLILLYTMPSLAQAYATRTGWQDELATLARLAGHTLKLEWRQEDVRHLPFFISNLLPAGHDARHIWRPQPVLASTAPPLPGAI